MSGGEGRKISPEELQMVHQSIEHCLSKYMTRQEVVKTLYAQQNIEPCLTELVWEQLERQNRDFFKEYYLRLRVKEHIMVFNKLLSKQAEMMCQPGPSGIGSRAMSNGSVMTSVQHNLPTCIVENGGPVLKSEDVPHPNSANSAVFAGVFNPSIQTAIDLSSHGREIDVSGGMLLACSSEEGTRLRGSGVVNPQLGCAADYPSYSFGAHSDLMESQLGLCDASVASFSSMESESRNINEATDHFHETLLDTDPSSFGYVDPISSDYCFSDLSDILESYSRSSILPPDESNILDTRGMRENRGDIAGSNITQESSGYRSRGV